MIDRPDTNPGAVPPSPARLMKLGVVIAVLVGLAATAHPVFSPAMLAHYADSPDSVDITNFAAQATMADIPLWWTGSWIQRSSPYYRPLSSMVFWAEYLAFGRNFQGHVVISWLVHGLICGLVYLLGVRLFTAPDRVRVLLALAAVVLFNLRRGPSGPGWLPAPVAYGVVAWWPGQTDQFCLLFALLALVPFDDWLTGRNPRGLGLAVGAWAASLLFKEMSVSLPLVAGCMVLYRSGWSALRLFDRTEEDGGARRFSPGLVWRVVAPGLLIVAGFLLLRSVFVPGAWGPKARTLEYFLSKATWYAAEQPRAIIMARGVWVVVVSAYLAACVYVYTRLPKRPSGVWLGMGMVIGAGALAHVFQGNFAVITVPEPLAALGVLTLFFLGIVVLLHARTALPWTLLGMLLFLHLPILHVQGPHYFYWPAAFWGLFNTSLLLCLWQWRSHGSLQWRAWNPEADPA